MDDNTSIMKIIGLTGGIATGKSTVTAMFRDAGIAVFDADACVHALMAPDGKGFQPIADAFPQAIMDGKIDRKTLGRIVYADDAKLKQLEAILHPLVREEELAFIRDARIRGDAMVLLDIPLLFESDAHLMCDMTIVTDCSPETQKQRAMARPTMTEDTYQRIIAKQMSRADRLARADKVINTEGSLEITQAAIHELIEKVKHDERNRARY